MTPVRDRMWFGGYVWGRSPLEVARDAVAARYAGHVIVEARWAFDPAFPVKAVRYAVMDQLAGRRRR